MKHFLSVSEHNKNNFIKFTTNSFNLIVLIDHILIKKTSRWKCRWKGLIKFLDCEALQNYQKYTISIYSRNTELYSEYAVKILRIVLNHRRLAIYEMSVLEI